MNEKMELKFELEDVDGRHSLSFTVSDMESWHDLVLKFTEFLALRYDYPMSHNVLFVTDYPFGRIKEQYVTPNEVELVLRNRQRNDALDSLWGDDE